MKYLYELCSWNKFITFTVDVLATLAIYIASAVLHSLGLCNRQYCHFSPSDVQMSIRPFLAHTTEDNLEKL